MKSKRAAVFCVKIEVNVSFIYWRRSQEYTICSIMEEETGHAVPMGNILSNRLISDTTSHVRVEERPTWAGLRAHSDNSVVLQS